MNTIIISSCIVALLYSIIRFFQMRVVEKENRPLKELVSDTCIVFLSTFGGLFIVDQLGAVDGLSHALGVSGGGGSSSGGTQAFTSKPNF